MLCWSPSRVANGHPPHGRVHRAPRPLRPPAQGPLLWLPCGVEARSGYPAASRHATTSPGAVSAPDHHGAEQVDETRGGVDLHGVAPRRPRRTTRPHAPLRSIALRNLRSQLLELGVAAGKLLGWRLNQDASANLCANEFAWYLMSSSSWPPRVQNLSNNLTTEEAVLRA